MEYIWLLILPLAVACLASYRLSTRTRSNRVRPAETTGRTKCQCPTCRHMRKAAQTDRDAA